MKILLSHAFGKAKLQSREGTTMLWQCFVNVSNGIQNLKGVGIATTNISQDQQLLKELHEDKEGGKKKLPFLPICVIQIFNNSCNLNQQALNSVANCPLLCDNS